MRLQTLWIPGPLPSLNELLGGKLRDRIRLKRQWLDLVVALAHVNRLLPQIGPVRMCYDFWERDRRRDLSNMFAGAVKIIEDALVRAGTLRNDSQRWVRAIEFGDVAINPGKPGVLVSIYEG